MSAPCPLLGFFVRATLRGDTPASNATKLIDDLVELLESNGMSAKGSARVEIEYSVYREGSQATHSDRQLVQAWAGRWTHVADIVVSDILELE